MPRIDGRALGIRSLQLDAAYCFVLGGVVAVAASWISGFVSLPTMLIAFVGVVVVVWAVLVGWMVLRTSLRLALQLVGGVNVVATVLIGVAAATVASPAAVIPVALIALTVAAFALSQVLALRNLASDRVDRATDS